MPRLHSTLGPYRRSSLLIRTEFLLSKGYEVHGIIRRSSSFNTSRLQHLYADQHESAFLSFSCHFCASLQPLFDNNQGLTSSSFIMVI